MQQPPRRRIVAAAARLVVIAARLVVRIAVAITDCGHSQEAVLRHQGIEDACNLKRRATAPTR